MGRGRRATALHLLKIVVAAAALVAAAGTQRPAVGEAAPLLPLRDLDGREVALSSLAGERGLVILFWAGWSERSVEALRTLDALRGEVAPRGVALAAVNVEHEHLTGDDLAALRATVGALKVGFPILVDDGLKLFRAYGVVSVPSTAVVTPDGKLAGFVPGFSATSREALIDAIHKLAGITRTVVTAPKGAPAALRWLQLGRLEISGGRESSARTAFERSAKTDPALADPVIELAALALDAGDLAGAKTLLDQAIAIDAAASAALRERARLAALDGHADQAIAALRPLAATATDPVACEYRGRLLAEGAPGRADAFACAAKAGGPDDEAMRSKPAAEAMRLYRRAAAIKR